MGVLLCKTLVKWGVYIEKLFENKTCRVCVTFNLHVLRNETVILIEL